MTEDNPYAPPIPNLIFMDESAVKDRLADRLTRFTAAILDSIIAMVFGVPAAFLLGIWDYAIQGQNAPFLLVLIATALGFLWFLIVQGYLLKKYGQTVGKMLTRIRISDLEGNVPDFTKVILLRYLPISLASVVPVVGPFMSLLDVLFIFRSDRRCLHDLIAGTKVVRAK